MDKMYPELKKAIKLLPPKPVIIEVGSHKGDFVKYALHQRPKAIMYAIEPSPKNYASLLKKYPKISYNIALCSKNESLLFYELKDSNKKEHTRSSSLYQKVGRIKKATSNKIIVVGMTLDAFIKEHKISHIDLIRFDCYGAEYLIFKTKNNFLKITDMILLTMHHTSKIFGKEYQSQRKEIVKKLSKAKFKKKLGKSIKHKGHIHQLWKK